MYIGSVQTNSQAQGQSTEFGAPAAPGGPPALSGEALTKAVTLNRVYARTIGWKDYTGQIAARLGIRASNPDIWGFVQAVANWQARNGIVPNGILGGEWHDLLTGKR